MSSHSISIAKFFVFQKNGGVNLAIWVDYHAQIVGYSNIIVIDHASQSLSTQKLLVELEQKGVQVFHFSGLFSMKHAFLTKQMNDAKNSASLLIPMDLDEYIVLVKNKTAAKENEEPRNDDDGDRVATFTTNPKSIRARLDFLNSSSLLKMNSKKSFKVSQYMSVPDDCNDPPVLEPPNLLFRFADVCNSIHFQRRQNLTHRSKTFFWSSTFVNTDQGNHFGQTIYPCRSQNVESCYFDSGLAYLHFHTSRFPIWLAKIVSRVTDSYSMDLSNCDAIGGHYCKMGRTIVNRPAEKLYEHWYDSLCKPKLKSSLMEFDGIYKQFCLN